jgi:hypothetical protein
MRKKQLEIDAVTATSALLFYNYLALLTSVNSEHRPTIFFFYMA